MLENVHKPPQNPASQLASQRRLAWRCRRGMLELDIVLQRFVISQFAMLTETELQQFDRLLEMPDNDLWALINQVGEQQLEANIPPLPQRIRMAK